MTETAQGHAELPDFYDPRVQIVYRILCDTETETPDGEHWEGFLARRSIKELFHPIAAHGTFPPVEHGAGAVTEAMRKRAARQITLVFQCHDLGYADDNGDFTCSASQIELLERLSAEAAERVLRTALRPDEAAGQGEARATSEQVLQWIALAYREPEDRSQINASRFTRWNMEVAYRAGETNAALPTATPRPEASAAPDIVPVGWQIRFEDDEHWTAASQQLAADMAGKDGWQSRAIYAADALAALRAELAAVKERLRLVREQRDEYQDEVLAAEAEVARLKDREKELVAGLEPFGHYFDLNDCAERDDDDALEVPIRDLRRARSLTATKGG